MNTEDSEFLRLEHEALLRTSRPEQSTAQPADLMDALRKAIAQPVQPADKATCQTCEALARCVMMDQVGRAA